jgi:hypothetical protein
MRTPLALTLAAVVAGCGSHLTAVAPPTARAGRGEPFRLYTHCGIQWARINGAFWRATQPLSDGKGNPPSGWGNPFQVGTLTFTSHATAEFSSPAGRVRFKRTKRTQPPVVCS